MSLRIQLLGPLLIQDKEGSLSEMMKWSKGCALLAYLIITEQTQSREMLADLLWDSSSTAQSLQNLRKLLSRMRKWVPELEVIRKQVFYPTDTAVSIDYTRIKHALATKDIAQMDDALRLYNDDLLSDFYLNDAPQFNEWLVLEREHLRQQVVAAHRYLCVAYSEQHKWEQGIDAAQRWLLIDDYDEESLRHLLQLLAANGQIDFALQQYELKRQQLWEDIGVEPDRETQEIAQQLVQLKTKTSGGIAFSSHC